MGETLFDFVARKTDDDGETQGCPAVSMTNSAPEVLAAPAIVHDAGAGAAAAPPPANPSTALVVTDYTPPDLGPIERLVRFAYKFGVSGSVLARPLRKASAPRILATVTEPLRGDAAAGMALRAGHFLILGLKLPVAQTDFHGTETLTAPVARYVHGFQWLADLAACSAASQGAATAERVLDMWLAANPAPPPKPGKGMAWSIEATAHRVLNWIVHAPLVLSTAQDAKRAKILTALSEQARWLDRHIGSAETRLAALVGWSAITAAGLLLPDGKPRRLYGEAGLVRALGEAVGEEGGMLSRSPTDQVEAIATIVRLNACYAAVERDPPEGLAQGLASLVPPLLCVVHNHDGLGSWQGAWPMRENDLARLIRASGVRVRPLRDARVWGYQRMRASESVVQLDAAPPPAKGEARFPCASTLAFELSYRGQRIVTNCGGAEAAGALVPARLEQGLRGTAAHSTLVLDNANSTAIHVRGGIGKGVSEVTLDRRTVRGGATRIEASHDGYAARYGLLHRRVLVLRDDGSELVGEDALVPTKGKGKRGQIGYAVRFHLDHRIEAMAGSDGHGVLLQLPDGSHWQFRCHEDVILEEGFRVDADARPRPARQIVVQGLASRGGASFAWTFKRMS